MKNSVKLAFVAALAVAGIAACTSAPAPQHNAAPQTSSSAPQTSSSAPQTVTNPPKANVAVKADNRIGYGPIKIGMTLDEARAAGLTDLTWQSDGDHLCVADDKLAISKRYGIVRITLPADAKTSTGIGVGSTFADVKKAYPNASAYRSGWSARVNDTVGYSFLGEPDSDANKVVGVKLISRDADCSMAYL